MRTVTSHARTAIRPIEQFLPVRFEVGAAGTLARRSAQAMIPIQDLLHRVQWDPEFGKAEFEIGYFDRVTGRNVHVPFRHVRFEKGEHFAFEAVEDDGSVHTVPLHRVREVRRNGELIWQRAPEPAGGG